MSLPSLRQLRTFLAAVETGSVTTAARSLGLTQPAASQQLRELERALGARLLERAGGKLLPTAAGQALLEPARRAQAAAEDAASAVAAYRSGEVGRVRLGTGATACIHLLPPILAAARQGMPGLEITVAIGNSEEVVRLVEVGELDIALVTLPVPVARSMRVTRLLRDPLVALLPDGMAATAGVLGPSQLGRLPLILYEQRGATRAIVDAWFRRAGFEARPIMELGSVEAIKVLVASGLGVSVLPELAVREPVRGAVTRRLRPALSRELGYVVRSEKVRERGLRVFTDELEKLGAAALSP
ncbi:MAG: LysR family transcriptional regulator [Alphaproteobacteria bacterium]|nr:LysR family transcriptional regulator [Alphaproteobacteria bacterium]